MNIKNERVILLRELLVTQMNHWILFPVYAVLLIELNNMNKMSAPPIFLWLALGILPFFLYFARTRLRKFGTLAFAHFAVIGLMLLLPAEHLMIDIFYIVIGAGYVIYSGYLWAATKNRQDYKFPPLLTVPLFVVTLFVLHYQEHTASDTLFMTILILVLAIYFVIYYIEQYQKFLIVNNSSAGHIPASEMFRSGIGLVLGYTGIGCLVLMLVANMDWLSGILKSIKNVITSIIRLIVSLFLQNTGEGNKIVEEPMGGGADMSPMEELGESFWLWEVLEYGIIMGLFVLVVFLLIKTIVFFIKFIKSKLGILHHDVQETSEKTVVDIREKCDIIKSQEWKMRFPFLPQNAKERIRHLYKKRILSSRSSFSQDGKTLLNQYTARESGRILDRKELAIIYEKARYSNMECDSEDVKRMRDACK